MIKNKLKYSLIITYFNEENKIKNIFNNIYQQSLKPDEVIFIDSNSTDNSYKIVSELIKKNKKKINFKNISVKTEFPSSSANIGIQLATNDFLAFMDMGLKFNKKFFEEQFNILQEKKCDLVYATCKLTGHGIIDQASVANTYGINKKQICVPGSVMKKKIFLKTGFFETSRSFFDVLWKRKVKSEKINYTQNFSNNIEYLGTNFAKDFWSLMKKNLIYYKSELLFKDLKIYLYLIFPFIIFFLFFYSKFFFYFLFSYIIMRLYIAHIKSFKFNIFKNPLLILNIILTALVIDFSRVIATYKNLLNILGVKNIFTFIMFFYFLLFFTPLINFAEFDLVKNQKIDKTNNYDAIVVFSGNGKLSFINNSYQQRAIDSYKAAKDFNTNKIILSSGRQQTLPEVEILKNFLVSKNIDEKKIHIIEEYPNSTYKMILVVGEYLKKNNLKNIIFITSPHHFKRSLLIWNKNYPNLKVLPLDNGEFKKEFKWFQNYEDVYVIFYEYLSILYNHAKGRL